MIATATAGAARAALALTIAICESDQAAADALLAAYPGEAGLRTLLDGYMHVLRSIALTRVVGQGGSYSEAAISAELRSLLTGPFAERPAQDVQPWLPSPSPSLPSPRRSPSPSRCRLTIPVSYP